MDDDSAAVARSRRPDERRHRAEPVRDDARAGDVAERVRARARPAAAVRDRAPGRARDRRRVCFRALASQQRPRRRLFGNGRQRVAAGRRPPRRQLGVRGEHDRSSGNLVRGRARRQAARARRHDVSRTDVQRPRVSELRRADDPSRARHERRSGRRMAGPGCERERDRLPQQRARPDRLRARSGEVPGSLVHVRLCGQH